MNDTVGAERTQTIILFDLGVVTAACVYTTQVAVVAIRRTVCGMKSVFGMARRILGRPRRTLVLTGGGARGAGQVGMLRLLLEEGLEFDAVVGCSVGALNAVRYANQPTIEALADLEAVWGRLRSRDLFPLTPYGVFRGVAGRSHLVNPRGLQALLEKESPVQDLGLTQVPLGVVTTRLTTGKAVLWTSGPTVEILSASCALPGILPPVLLTDGVEHIDGGVSSAAPVLLATQNFPTDEVWLLDVMSTPDEGHHHRTLRDVYQASFSHAVKAQVDNELRALRGPHLRHVKLPTQWSTVDSTDFSKTTQLVRAGYLAAGEYLGGANRH
jgi:NTE family protein